MLRLHCEHLLSCHVNTTPKMPWEYSENICERMATGKSWMNWYSITTRRIRTTKWTTRSGTESTMRQMPMTTEMTTLHRTSPLAWHCTLSTLTSTSTESAHHERAQSCSLLTLAQVRALSALHSRPSSWPSTWAFSLHVDLLRSLLPSFPPVLLPLPFLLPQRRAAAGAQPEDHGKPALLRDQRGWGHLRRPLPPRMSSSFTCSQFMYSWTRNTQGSNNPRRNEQRKDRSVLDTRHIKCGWNTQTENRS